MMKEFIRIGTIKCDVECKDCFARQQGFGLNARISQKKLVVSLQKRIKRLN